MTQNEQFTQDLEKDVEKALSVLFRTKSHELTDSSGVHTGVSENAEPVQVEQWSKLPHENILTVADTSEISTTTIDLNGKPTVIITTDDFTVNLSPEQADRLKQLL